MYPCYIHVGDWSNDGHEKSDKIYLQTSHDPADLFIWLKNALTQLGIKPDELWGEYEQFTLADDTIEKLKAGNVAWELADEHWFQPEDAAELMLQIIKTQVPDLTWEYSQEETPCLNIPAYGDNGVDYVSIGYGLYN